jgi:hypothetical protein
MLILTARVYPSNAELSGYAEFSSKNGGDPMTAPAVSFQVGLCRVEVNVTRGEHPESSPAAFTLKQQRKLSFAWSSMSTL